MSTLNGDIKESLPKNSDFDDAGGVEVGRKNDPKMESKMELHLGIDF